MKRIAALCGAFGLILTGCADEYGYNLATAPQALSAQVVAGAQNAQLFAYRHSLRMEMELDRVEPRFERARNLCLEDAELNCILIGAELNVSDSNYGARRYGVLSVSLPHDQVSVFEQRLVAPLAGERSRDAVIVSRSTSAENVTGEAVDIERRLAQLIEYHDRLNEISQRADVSVDELIRIAGELSETQGELDEITAKQSSVSERVERERLSVTLYARPGFGNAISPLTRVAGNSVEIISASTAGALRFVLSAIPWLPILAAGFFLITWLLRMVRRRFARAPIKTPAPAVD